jgi:hypothetical protein
VNPPPLRSYVALSLEHPPQAEEKTMKTAWTRAVVVALSSAGLAAALGAITPPPFHDPRSVAAKLSQGFEIPGAGRFDVNYGALHFNESNYKAALQNPGVMSFFNGNIWGKLGTAKLAFEVTSGDVKLPAGDYDFGINMAKDDAFSVVFWAAGAKTPTAIPLKVEKEQKPVGHLAITLLATDVDNVYTLEARCGPYRGTADLKVPPAPAKKDAPPAKKGA